MRARVASTVSQAETSREASFAASSASERSVSEGIGAFAANRGGRRGHEARRVRSRDESSHVGTRPHGLACHRGSNCVIASRPHGLACHRGSNCVIAARSVRSAPSRTCIEASWSAQGARQLAHVFGGDGKTGDVRQRQQYVFRDWVVRARRQIAHRACRGPDLARVGWLIASACRSTRAGGPAAGLRRRSPRCGRAPRRRAGPHSL